MATKLEKNLNDGKHDYRSSALTWMAAATLLVCSAALLASCANESASERAEAVGGVTAAQIINNPNAYVGKTVTVSGDVEEVHGPRAFKMDSGVSLGELLVVGREAFPQMPENGNRAVVVSDTATVTGTVRMLVTAEVERELGWDLQPELEAEFQAKPVLIAQNLSFKPGANRAADANATPTSSMNMNNSNAAMMNANSSADPITDVLVIVTPVDRLPLVGRRVQFTNVRVQSMVGDRGFFIGPSNMQRLYVRLDKALDSGRAEAIVNVNEGQVRTLSGVLRRVPNVDQIKKEFGLNDAEAAALERDRVYLAADRIELLDRK